MAETVLACPDCGRTPVYERDVKTPPYRCVRCGAEFAEPLKRENRVEAGEYVDTDDLLKDLKAVADEMGKAPTVNDYATHGEYSTATVYHRFDSWRDALEAAGVEVGDTPTSGSETKYGLEDLSPEDIGLPPAGERKDA